MPCGQPGIPQTAVLLTEPALSHSALGGVRESPGNAFLVKKEEKPGFKVTICAHSLGCVFLHPFPPLAMTTAGRAAFLQE